LYAFYEVAITECLLSIKNAFNNHWLNYIGYFHLLLKSFA